MIDNFLHTFLGLYRLAIHITGLGLVLYEHHSHTLSHIFPGRVEHGSRTLAVQGNVYVGTAITRVESGGRVGNGITGDDDTFFQQNRLAFTVVIQTGTDGDMTRRRIRRVVFLIHQAKL